MASSCLPRRPVLSRELSREKRYGLELRRIVVVRLIVQAYADQGVVSWVNGVCAARTTVRHARRCAMEWRRLVRYY